MPAKKSLTHAYKREILSLGSTMVKITYQDEVIECSNADEAIKVLTLIEQQKRSGRIGAGLQKQGINVNIDGLVEPVWTNQTFREFAKVLRKTQEQALEFLLRKKRITDEEWRKALGLDSNQQLAGVLSGISKKAVSLGIPARSIFLIENESKSGEMTKTYVVALEFLAIASENNWLAE